MNIVVCCPSYKRPKVKTLEYLPFVKVYVDGSEYEEYCEQNKGCTIVRCDDGIQGNVARVRNYILDTEFEAGADAVCILDDDIYRLSYFKKADDSDFGYERVEIKKDDFFWFLEKYTLLWC